MEIKGLGNNFSYTNNISQENKKPETAAPAAQDKIEISKEAKIKNQKSGEIKNLDQIQQKIKDKFYDSDAVINQVANAILKEINSSK